jgi:predicted nucleic acid-binding protein
MRVESQMSYAELVWREPLGVAETPAEYVFHRPKLYLETTIPSYLTARTSRDVITARLQNVTKRWWNSWRTQFEIYISDIVLKEVTAGDSEAAQRRRTILEGFTELESDGESRALAARIVEVCGLPGQATNDAEHVALAAMHGLDFLLTWNCAHLANPHIVSKIELACQARGYSCPVLCTPEQLMEKYEHATTQ